MNITKLSIPDYLETCKDAARERGFVWILIFLARELDENTTRPILLVTANDNETNAFLEEPEFKYERIRGLKKADSNFYYKGNYYGYQVVHFQTPNQGSVQSGSAGFSVQAAIEEFNPCAVIMFGIAFGFDDGEYKIGAQKTFRKYMEKNMRLLYNNMT